MSLLGLFAASVHGMNSQSDAMNAIAGNIANLKTGGYKRTDVQFATVLSRSVSNQNGSGASAAGSSHADFGGSIAKSYARIGTPGEIESSGGALDLAINGGRGFFVVNPYRDGSGEALFTRDGTFATGIGPDTTVAGIGGAPITVQEGYLVDKNGFYLQGWDYDPAGSYGGDLGGLHALRVDGAAFGSIGEATTSAKLALNLPPDSPAGTLESFPIHGVDTAGNAWMLESRFIKDPIANSWRFDIADVGGGSVAIAPPADFSRSIGTDENMEFDAATATIGIRSTSDGRLVGNAFAGLAAGDAITVAGTALNNGVYTVKSIAPDGASLTVDPTTPLAADETAALPATVAAAGVLGQPLTFKPDGTLAGAGQYDVAVSLAGGATSTFSFDLGAVTQFAGGFPGGKYSQDGFPASNLAGVSFDQLGHVVGRFESGLTRNLYRVALANFTNADGLSMVSGNLFAASADSGAASIGVAGEDGVGLLMPGARELSNVDMADEFAKMIKTQTVYNASATSLRTQDEMLQKLDEL